MSGACSIGSANAYLASVACLFERTTLALCALSAHFVARDILTVPVQCTGCMQALEHSFVRKQKSFKFYKMSISDLAFFNILETFLESSSSSSEDEEIIITLRTRRIIPKTVNYVACVKQMDNDTVSVISFYIINRSYTLF